VDAASKALPASVAEEVREALDAARQEIDDAVRQAREDARTAAEEARAAAQEAQQDAAEDALVHVDADGKVRRVRVVRLGSAFTEIAFLWIVASAIIKITYKRQIQAEAQAAQAVETAEAESLKRQVAEARMAAMQAQIEPHFLFNTLASIDHLIEVDPQRASQMQKHLIALLRATMPTMREANGSAAAPRDLGRELSVIRPYLEILKVRMEERLATEISVPEGLQSAEFPAMMIQTLVENAIKHGLEPKPEGGRLRVSAEIVHGKLAVSVADTGLGFGKAATAGTGVGLANIRERLALLYGGKARLTVAENPGGGTVVTIAVPYRPIETAAAA
jgi:sensor histidine kinase YesM